MFYCVCIFFPHAFSHPLEYIYLVMPPSSIRYCLSLPPQSSNISLSSTQHCYWYQQGSKVLYLKKKTNPTQFIRIRMYFYIIPSTSKGICRKINNNNGTAQEGVHVWVDDEDQLLLNIKLIKLEKKNAV